MKTKTILIRFALGIVALFLLLSCVLVVHVYKATHKPKTAYELRQMSRIDFKQPISSTEAVIIRNHVVNLKGIENATLNAGTRQLIFVYNSEKQSAESVLSEVKKLGDYKAEKFVVSEEMAQTGCPALGDKDSFKYKLTALIASL